MHAHTPAGLARAVLAVFLCLSAIGGCRSPYYADRGALLGGLAGAGVGAAIGDAHDKSLAGALIGSAVGATTGAVIGNGLDEVSAQNRALIEERLGRPLSGTASVEDTIAMSRAGLGDEIIINHLRTNGFAGRLTSAELIYMKQQGVSDGVLGALQQVTATVPTVPEQPVYAPPPVIVEEHYYARPLPPPYAYPPPWRHAHRSHASWGISVHQ